MIGFISGVPMETEGEKIIINVAGVGYELTCSQNSLKDVADLEIADLFVHTHVREDNIQLFGFSTKNEKQMFMSLLKVNGVGPKMAITILSGAVLKNIISWINAGDVKALTSLPKVGKKTAEQMILSLKDKLMETSSAYSGGHVQMGQQIKSALINLGYRASDIDAIADQYADSETVQEGIRIALKQLSSKLLGQIEGGM